MTSRPVSAPSRARTLPDLLAGLADALVLLLIATIIAVILTDGWQLQLRGVTISMRSVGNLLLAALALLALRLRHPDAPLLWRRGTTTTSAATTTSSTTTSTTTTTTTTMTLATSADAALRLVQRARAALDTVDQRRALRIIALLAAAATLIRLVNVYVYFGFITGDDVEIHEMTLASVLGRDWTVWDLRSPFYPMTFIYPVQRLAAAAGVTDVFTLIAAGRLIVVAIAALNIWLVYRVAEALFAHRGTALLAAGLFAFNHLHMTYGSAELPRVVASAFMLGAFWSLLRPTRGRAALAGLLLAIGACLRFGEMVFAAPALLTILGWPVRPTSADTRPLADRLLRILIVALVGLATAAVIFGVGDALYWGEPFHSLRAIVDYTLVRKLSSRGYESFVYYLTHLADWSNVLLVLLALGAARVGGALPLLWALAPIALLSLLPHKEPRYVIVTIPFLAIAAGRTLWVWITRLDAARESVVHARDTDAARARNAPHVASAARVALCLIAALAAAALFDVSRFRFHRSEEAVRLARTIADSGQSGVAAEQLWRFGGQLYLSDRAPLIDLDPGLPDDAPALRDALCRADVHWSAFRRERLSDARRALLRDCGFTNDSLMSRDERYVLYRK